MHPYRKASPSPLPVSPEPPPLVDGYRRPPSISSSPSSAHSQENGTARLTAAAKRQKYFRRLFKFRQMDFEYAFWQMFLAVSLVYRVRVCSTSSLRWFPQIHRLGYLRRLHRCRHPYCISIMVYHQSLPNSFTSKRAGCRVGLRLRRPSERVFPVVDDPTPLSAGLPQYCDKP
ncbi:Protein unc-50 homolog,Protein unc-50 homolog A,Protein unc-50 homolog B [Acanthosepion pharaonis]|uniref:Protein unc-50 homolog,Protein unc-50 homolog A,Protein unc-50 homolog B n=1 Tax=Acanthosepion pharaonis TaxID=158019 RepID=A0A812DQ47_ACAPH|nr:Protein unc-50 homolog,Protein unc-50 homolog A,Protein unc-50 homolog B [Sepia pharaonis]